MYKTTIQIQFTSDEPIKGLEEVISNPQFIEDVANSVSHVMLVNGVEIEEETAVDIVIDVNAGNEKPTNGDPNAMN